MELWARLQAELASVAELTAQVQALQERLGKPPKTPDNSSLPPSKGEKPQTVYDRIELPPVRPHVTRVELHGCACPQCGKPVLAAAPAGLGRGSPFGESIAQLATYLRYAHAISYQRLCALFRDVFGLQISEGALANLFRRVQGRLGGTLEEIRARVRASRVVKSDETGARVQGRKAWE